MIAKVKKHNSILFLTTLSVYLGLVLVGATPQVLAQAALTRSFDIKTEIELEDDLDKNPDEKALEKYSDAFQSLVSLAREFAENNRENLRGKDFQFDCSFILRANDASRTSCAESGLFSSEFVTPFREITKAFPHVESEQNEQARFNLVLSGTGLVLKTSLNLDSDVQAEKTSIFFENLLLRRRSEQSRDLTAIIYDNTEFSAVNNQVFIVTRLPRASIDELPAQKKVQ